MRTVVAMVLLASALGACGQPCSPGSVSDAELKRRALKVFSSRRARHPNPEALPLIAASIVLRTREEINSSGENSLGSFVYKVATIPDPNNTKKPTDSINFNACGETVEDS